MGSRGMFKEIHVWEHTTNVNYGSNSGLPSTTKGEYNISWARMLNLVASTKTS